MFRGNQLAKIDEKGRLKFPAAFKQQLDAQNVTQFYITSTDGNCAEIWPLPVWEEREKALAPNADDETVRKYLNWTSYYGQQVEIDNQGRVLLPQLLRGKAKLDAEVIVFGKTSILEVHNREVFEKYLAGNEFTDRDRTALNDKIGPRK